MSISAHLLTGGTYARETLFAFKLGLELQAFEFALEHGVWQDDGKTVTFPDDTKINVLVSEDHEITITEV